jgi:hypothetical protein
MEDERLGRCTPDPKTSVPTRSREFDFRHENPGMRSSGNSAIVLSVAENCKTKVFREADQSDGIFIATQKRVGNRLRKPTKFNLTSQMRLCRLVGAC